MQYEEANQRNVSDKCHIQREKNILIWLTGTDEKEVFLLDSLGKLVCAKNKKGLKKKIGNDYLNVQWSESTEMDFDKFWIALKNLRVGKASSKKTCAIINDGWNIMEDLLRTFSMTKAQQRLKSKLLNKAYDKFFYGMNLPSVTPENSSYSPLWNHNEITALKKKFKMTWDVLQLEMKKRM